MKLTLKPLGKPACCEQRLWPCRDRTDTAGGESTKPPATPFGERAAHRDRLAAQDDFDQLVLVDGVVERLPDFLLLEDVGGQEAWDQDDRAEFVARADLDTRLVLQSVDLAAAGRW